MPVRTDDLAILIGINDYPGVKFADLSGPPNDVLHFERWLVDPAGGNMDPARIHTLISPNPKSPAGVTQYPPTQAEFYALFRSLMFPPGSPAPIRTPNGRLYLFFSGHGFSDVKDNRTQAAVYCANAQPGLSWNVCGTAIANWCVRAAVFGEVVLIMDCCRDAEISKKTDVVPLDDVTHADQKRVRLLEVYAVPFGEKAQERHFADVDRKHGILTYALVAALYGAPLEASGAGAAAPQERNGHAVKKFLEGCWDDVAGESGPEPPEVVLPKQGDISLSFEPPRAVPRRIRFQPPVTTAATLTVLGDGAPEITANLDATQGTATIVNGGPAATEAFDGKTIVVNLRPEIYEIRLDVPGNPVRTAFVQTIGDQDIVC